MAFFICYSQFIHVFVLVLKYNHVFHFLLVPYTVHCIVKLPGENKTNRFSITFIKVQWNEHCSHVAQKISESDSAKHLEPEAHSTFKRLQHAITHKLICFHLTVAINRNFLKETR